MTEVILRKTNIAGRPCLVSVDDEGADLLHKLKDGRDVGCEVKRHRNPRFHRLYWATIKFIQMHAPRFEGVPLEKIHVALKLATGLVDTFVDAETGRVCYVPKSTAWAAMEQNEFARWFEEACRVVATRWMHPGVTPEDVRRELIEMVDGRYALEASRS